jgi:hypothetical protein
LTDFLVGDQGPFTDIQPNVWSGTDLPPIGLDEAFYFAFVNGGQDERVKVVEEPAWAVRAGDVAAVPESGTAVLMALGLLGLGAGPRKRRAT